MEIHLPSIRGAIKRLLQSAHSARPGPYPARPAMQPARCPSIPPDPLAWPWKYLHEDAKMRARPGCFKYSANRRTSGCLIAARVAKLPKMYERMNSTREELTRKISAKSADDQKHVSLLLCFRLTQQHDIGIRARAKQDQRCGG